MTLHHITEEVCRDCSSAVSIEEVGFPHTNGTRQEYRTFCCGAKIEYVPAFRYTVQVRPCPNSPEQLKMKEQRKRLLNQLRELINADVEVDEEYRKALIRALEYAY